MITSRRLHALADDSGVALVTVIGIISVMTVVALAAFALSMQNTTDVRRAVGTSQAFQAANAGVDAALSRIQVNGYVSTDFPATGSTASGSFIATVTPGTNGQYQCLSTGTDPTTGQHETILVNFFYLNLWNMNMANGTGGLSGGGLVGTTNEWGPFYLRGNVNISGNTAINLGPLFIVGGDLNLSGSGAIGATGGPVDLYCSGSYPTPGSQGMNVGSISHAPPDIQLPVVDQAYLQSKFNQAKLESIDNMVGTPSGTNPTNLEALAGNPATYQSMNPPNGGWTRPKAPGAATFYKVVGTDTSIGAIDTGTHGLTIGGTGSWGSGSGDGHYTLSSHDDFWYDDTQNPGVLYVEGTVFVDGPVTFNKDIMYRGNGSIVANGDITINGQLVPDSGGNHYMDATHVLGLVTPGAIVDNVTGSNGRDPLNCTPDLCGAFFARQQFQSTGNAAIIKGSIIAGGINISHPNAHLVTDPQLPEFIPDAMPGVGNSYLIKGSWSRK